MPLDLVMAVALWCGNPGQNSVTGSQTAKSVQQCRDAIISCIPNKSSGQENYVVSDWMCFLNQKFSW